MAAGKSKKPVHSSGDAPGGPRLRPVGVIKNTIKEPVLAARHDGLEMRGKIDAAMAHFRELADKVSEIVIDQHLVGLLDGIEEYSHLVVLYWAHKVADQHRSLTKVHPLGRKEIPMVGIFSTCSPVRPNPVLVTVVRLRGRKENILEVTGLDAVDGSPVIDIKPYLKESHPRDEVRIPEWMQRIQKEFEAGGGD